MASKRAAVTGIAMLGVLLWTRLEYAPGYLYFFDNANFALSMIRFDPGLHQPQPPGYPLFVALLKVVHLFVSDANICLIIAGLLGSAVGLFLVWKWATEMFGATAGVIAAVLLLFHPVFWYSAIANPVRTFLVVIGSAVAIACWRALNA